MNILFVSAIMPYPLRSGGQVRVYNLLSRLSKRHDISLFTFVRTHEETSFKQNLTFCKKVEYVFRGKAKQPRYIFRAFAGKYPLLFTSYDLEEMRLRIKDELHNAASLGRPYDLVHIEPGYVWPSLPDISIPLVVAEHNIEHKVYELYVRHTKWQIARFVFDKDVEKLKFWEEHVWKRAHTIIAVHEGERDYIEKIVPDKSLYVVPNGVDIDIFTFKKKTFPKDAMKCLYVGNFAWIQNTNAVSYLLSDIWPKVIRAYPHATLRIIGAHMPSFLRRRVGESKNVEADVSVENIAKEYHASHILLAPIRVGGGTKYKILESLATGTPVITSELGAEGIEKESIYIAKSGEEYVDQLRHIWTDPHIDTKLKKARATIENKYSWAVITEKLERAWHETLKSTH